jgi:O-antigen ligase
VGHLRLWEAALGAIQESPVLGIGLGVSKIRETMERLAIEHASDPKSVFDDKSSTMLIHNHFLQTWTECGIFGLASLIFIIWVYCKRIWRYVKNIEPEAEDKIICFGLFVSSIAMMLLNLTISFFDMEIWVIMAIALGIASKPELIKHSGSS